MYVSLKQPVMVSVTGMTRYGTYQAAPIFNIDSVPVWRVWMLRTPGNGILSHVGAVSYDMATGTYVASLNGRRAFLETFPNLTDACEAIVLTLWCQQQIVRFGEPILVSNTAV